MRVNVVNSETANGKRFNKQRNKNNLKPSVGFV